MLNKITNYQSSLVITQIPRKKQFYKTKMCPWFFSGKCDRGVDCLFAHSQDELNPIPDLSYTSLCPLAKKSGLCKNEKCNYAHSVCELRPTGDLYKTAPCTKFMRGKCNAEEHCRHAHFIEELRPLPGNLTPSQNAVNLMLSTSLSNSIYKINKKNIVLSEDKNDKLLKQSISLTCKFPSQNKFSKKGFKNSRTDNNNIINVNNKNYQKSASFPNKMYPILFKNKENNAESKSYNSLNFKNYMINNEEEQSNNSNIMNAFNITKYHSLSNKNKKINTAYKWPYNLRSQDNSINNGINHNKIYNNVNNAQILEKTNHNSSFSTKEPSTPMRMSSTSSKDFVSNNEENNFVESNFVDSNFVENNFAENNFENTIEHMEITAQDSALKVIEDDSEKMNYTDIKNYINLLQMKKLNSFNNTDFLFNGDNLNSRNAIYPSYKSLPSPKDKLKMQLNLESYLSEHYLNKSIQHIRNEEENDTKYDPNNNLKNIHKLNNNSLINCSNFWNYTEDELSIVAPQIPQKVEIFDY